MIELLIIFSLGLSIGSFLGVIVDRVPAGRSIVYPPSTCSTCGHRLGVIDLVPIVGYLSIGGKCRYCRAKLSMKYPVMEVITGLLFGAIWMRAEHWWEFLTWATFASFLMVMFLIDLEHMLLPNKLNLAGALAGMAFGALGWSGNSLGSAVLGAVCGYGIIFGIALLSREGMGMGDAKFLGAIGAYLGPVGALLTLFAASAIGVAVGITLMLMGRLDRKTPMPFSPYLAMGALLTLWLR